jgi:hypothetical protein
LTSPPPQRPTLPPKLYNNDSERTYESSKAVLNYYNTWGAENGVVFKVVDGKKKKGEENFYIRYYACDRADKKVLIKVADRDRKRKNTHNRRK